MHMMVLAKFGSDMNETWAPTGAGAVAQRLVRNIKMRNGTDDDIGGENLVVTFVKY